jgi:hypothetical protein
VLVSCSGDSSGSSPAFNVTTAGTFAATFTLNGGATDLYVVTSGNAVATNCSDLAGSVVLTSGNPTALSTGSYNYCIDATAGFTAFAVSWTQ